MQSMRAAAQRHAHVKRVSRCNRLGSCSSCPPAGGGDLHVWNNTSPVTRGAALSLVSTSATGNTLHCSDTQLISWIARFCAEANRVWQTEFYTEPNTSWVCCSCPRCGTKLAISSSTGKQKHPLMMHFGVCAGPAQPYSCFMMTPLTLSEQICALCFNVSGHQSHCWHNNLQN